VLQYIRNVMHAKREDGASAVEYGLLVAAIAALIVVVVFVLGGVIQKVFKNTCGKISDKATTGPATCATQ
jgi:pilus assembly protein Flp/PilA